MQADEEYSDIKQEYSEGSDNSLVIKPKYYKQTYRPAWEQMTDFKGWLRGIPGQPTRAYCTYCQKSLHAHRLSLLKHTCTIRHQKAAQINFIRQQQKSTSNETEGMSDQLETVKIVIAGSSQDDGEEYETAEVLEAEDNEVGDEDKYQDEDEYQDEDDDDEGEQMPELTTHMQKQVRQQARVSAMIGKPPISTHVLDTAKGQPVAGLQVSLYKLIDGRWTYINEAITTPDGRCNTFLQREDFTAGRYKLHYDVDRYFELRKQESLYPFVEIVFDCRAPVDHYHIPLLLSPFGYTTYRGS